MACQVRLLALGLKLRFDIFGLSFNLQVILQLTVRWDNLSELMPNAGVEVLYEAVMTSDALMPYILLKDRPPYFFIAFVSAQEQEGEGRRGGGRTATKRAWQV